MKLIVGLGNPGKDYVMTRHNIGWLALDTLAKKHQTLFQKKKEFEADIADFRIGDERIFLVKPLTYMNLSGRAVVAVKNYYKIADEDVLIVHDEMDFPFGRLGLMQKGGAAGHNGIKSIHESLGTSSVGRLRLGIGRPTPPLKMEDYVLQRFSSDEQSEQTKFLDRAREAMQTWITSGLTQAMNLWNGVEHGLDQGEDRASQSRPL